MDGDGFARIVHYIMMINAAYRSPFYFISLGKIPPETLLVCFVPLFIISHAPHPTSLYPLHSILRPEDIIQPPAPPPGRRPEEKKKTPRSPNRPAESGARAPPRLPRASLAHAGFLFFLAAGAPGGGPGVVLYPRGGG